LTFVFQAQTLIVSMWRRGVPNGQTEAAGGLVGKEGVSFGSAVVCAPSFEIEFGGARIRVS
jgi:hypothetical protein